MSPEFFNQVFFIGQKNCLDAKHLIFADVTAKNMSASGASELKKYLRILTKKIFSRKIKYFFSFLVLIVLLSSLLALPSQL